MSYLTSLKFAGLCFLFLFVAQESNHGVVRFPEAWTKKTADGRTAAFTNTGGFEVRKNVRVGPNELVFAMKQVYTSSPGKSESAYSDDFFAVSLDGRFRVHRVDAAEWQHAEQLPKALHEIRYDSYRPDPRTHTDGEVIYEQKKYRKSGQFWPSRSALISSSGAWMCNLCVLCASVVVFANHRDAELEPLSFPFGSRGYLEFSGNCDVAG